jgi:hypothetical protein
MDWARILAFVTGMVDQELLARIEYLAAENRILKAQAKGRLKLSDAERATLGEIGNRLGRKVLGEVANVARPDTILARNYLAHASGDAINAVLAAAGYNFRRLLAWLRFLLLRILVALGLAAQLKLA